MKEGKFKYDKQLIQLCIIKVAFLVSVFLFSGYNEKIQETHLESDKTELINSKNYSSSFSFSKVIQNTRQSVQSLAIDWRFNKYFWGLFIFNQSQASTFKSISKKFLSYNCTLIKLPIKSLPSSSDEAIPSFPIG